MTKNNAFGNVMVFAKGIITGTKVKICNGEKKKQILTNVHHKKSLVKLFEIQQT